MPVGKLERSHASGIAQKDFKCEIEFWVTFAGERNIESVTTFVRQQQLASERTANYDPER